MLPDPALLSRSTTGHPTVDVEHLSDSLTRTLGDLGATCRLVNSIVGPQTICFELEATGKTRMTDFTRLKRSSDLMYATASQTVRIEAPIPGRQVVGVEIANPLRHTVLLGDVLGVAQAPLTAAIGMDQLGASIGFNLAGAPHTLVAGRSGAGKTVLIHSILSSLLMVATPAELALVLIDVKMTEFPPYNGLPHLYGNVVVDVDRAIDALWWCVEEMEERYRRISGTGHRDILSYNQDADVPLPHCLIVVDELADLVMRGKGEVETAIARLGQKGRAAGVSLLLATQTPRSTVVSGLIKANLPARIALATSSALDSRIILDHNGAETLLGKGDLLLDDGISGSLQRLQAPYTSPEDVAAIVGHWTAQAQEEKIAA